MKCPHCTVEINPSFRDIPIGDDKEGKWVAYAMNCPNPNCHKLIIDLASGRMISQNNRPLAYNIETRFTIRPLSSGRPPVPIEVEESFSKDYSEACIILPYSPKASAALSRRSLQNILREKAKVKKGDLSNEIQELIDSKTLPGYLIDSIDAVRNIGNFAAHPVKSKSTGEIVEVESGEAEWLLDVIESLFDFYFVQPALLQAKRDSLNKKLVDIGKPPMK